MKYYIILYKIDKKWKLSNKLFSDKADAEEYVKIVQDTQVTNGVSLNEIILNNS